ncbi:hypothetical protein HGQ17_06785 [Nesterenkonia sp. MY13]|uniref:Uncharacterized protein n=1 Tax=Nesterenkonia sedimenti TaxID=1463632 RepID=A0A7X8YDQ7_9MICC|nr:hypothetical protein [Nesterenkonia sedimenti]NLS09715.1 hypothetical protein [Nesterenkonia sedimenti]
MKRNGKTKSTTTPGWGALALIGVTGLTTGCGIFGGSDRLAGDLEYLPVPSDSDDDPSFHRVDAVDFEAVSELTGHEQPEPGASEDEFRDWQGTLFGLQEESADSAPIFVTLPGHQALTMTRETSVEDTAAQFGFSPLHMDRVSAYSGPAIYGVFEGDYEEELLDAAYGEPSEAGVWDNNEPDSRERAGAVEIDGKIAFGGEETLQLADGDVETLADQDGAVAVAEAIDDNDWFWAVLVSGPYDLEDGAEVQWRGHSVWLEDETYTGHFYWYHSSSEDAEANRELIETYLQELEQSWGIESLEMGVDNQLVTAEVDFTESPRAIQLAEQTLSPPFY